MRRLTISLMWIALALSVAAQSEDDAPGKGVARLSVMDGDVSIRRGDSGDFIAAAINAPLVVTDRLVTGPASRAELQFDWSNMIRIGSNAEVRLADLDNGRYQIQVAIGTTTFRVLRDSNAQVEISTPSVAVRPLGRGVYRVTVLEDGSSEITVRLGEAEIYTPRGAERLRAGGTMRARGSASDPEFMDAPAIPLDAWDRWNEDRDRMIERTQSYGYMSPDIDGGEDLDGHGRWVSVDSYGPVWVPTVAPGWAPYQLGRWVWVDYYGWTWVSYDPWGWAPYHYGRWFHSPQYGWCWWPGARRDRHFWRPALVSFFGFGAYGGFHSGIGFGFGNIGWVPLAPHEPFHPWYGRNFYSGHGYAGNGVIVNNTNIANVYRNSRAPNGITGMSSEAFGRRSVGRAEMVHVDATQVQNAGLVRGVLPLTPGRDSLRMADRNASSPAFNRAVENRTFYSRTGVNGSRTSGSFERQRTSVQQLAQRTFSNTSDYARAGQGRGSAEGGRTAPATSGNGGWRRVGEGSRQAQEPDDSSRHRFGDPSRRTAAPAASGDSGASSGWRRFGGPSSTSESDSGGDRSGRGVAPLPREQYGSYDNSRRTQATPRSGFGDSQPVRISPPIVRERPSSESRQQPSYSGGSGRGSAPASGGGSSRGSSSGGGGSSPSRGSSGGNSGGGGGGGGSRGHSR
ncbi:MAG: FecR domain-containing protein [Acidobacteria bacterium]|nr:FecR domain-containing protein [Acidobacteriota bacterium]